MIECRVAPEGPTCGTILLAVRRQDGVQIHDDFWLRHACLPVTGPLACEPLIGRQMLLLRIVIQNINSTIGVSHI